MKKSMVEVSFFLLCAVLLCSCSGKNLQNNLSQMQMVQGKELDTEEVEIQRACVIKERLMQLDDLQGVAVVVEGNTALIGLRLDQTAKTDVLSLKRQAEQLAKEADERIQDASVTANERITAMIERMEHQRAS